MADLSFAWLEITGRCQLRCEHCYADSGPQGTDGQMTVADWIRVIGQAAALGASSVQFIGGEPTLHRSLPVLVGHARDHGLVVEVFSNLLHVPPQVWKILAQPGVRLATSYYTDGADEHDSVTRRRGSYARTKANIAEAVRRAIPLRVGLISVRDGQRLERAYAELRSLGVTEFGFDRLRQVGRGVRDRKPSVSELCGHCGNGKIAVAADGNVWPCVFARWLSVGNVLYEHLAEIVSSTAMRDAERQVAEAAKKDKEQQKPGCDPLCCPSTMCDPQCSPSCSPSCRPAGNCRPVGNCAPKY